MIINPRIESPELLTLRYLTPRKKLSEKERNKLTSLEKGFVGEKKFDVMCETFLEEWRFLTGLLLDYNHSFFQIDSLGVVQDELYLFDVKNNEGDYIVKGDNWQHTTGAELKNPLHQLKRCETLLKRLLKDHGFQFTIKPYLIFINPQFTLYNAPLDPSIIFPTQLDRFMDKLQFVKTKYHKKHDNLINLLLSSNHSSYPNSLEPAYHYDELLKGVFCKGCCSTMQDSGPDKRGKLFCPTCGYTVGYETAVQGEVKELQHLFPDRKVTIAEVFEWCDGLIGKKSIQRVLAKNYNRMGRGRFTYYTH